MYFLLTFVCLLVRVWRAPEGAGVRVLWRRICLCTQMLNKHKFVDYTSLRRCRSSARAASARSSPSCVLPALSVADSIESGRIQPQGSTHALGWRSGAQPALHSVRRVALSWVELCILSLHHTLRELFRITTSGVHRATTTRLWLVRARQRKQTSAERKERLVRRAAAVAEVLQIDGSPEARKVNSYVRYVVSFRALAACAGALGHASSIPHASEPKLASISSRNRGGHAGCLSSDMRIQEPLALISRDERSAKRVGGCLVVLAETSAPAAVPHALSRGRRANSVVGYSRRPILHAVGPAQNMAKHDLKVGISARSFGDWSRASVGTDAAHGTNNVRL